VGKRQGWLVASIGVFKLVKAVALITFGVGMLVAPPGHWASVIESALGWGGGSAGRETLIRFVARLGTVPPGTARHVAPLALAYAAVFTVEGVGLLARRRWAEWLTVVVTVSFIPLEIYELFRHVSAAKVVALVLNVAIAGYLAYRRIHESRGMPRFARRPNLKLVAEDGRTFEPRHGAVRP
jgi:uncharacterized membrane protein (DUF2068 family)